MNRLAVAFLTSAFLCSGCDKSDDSVEGTDPTEQLPAKYKSLEPVPPPNFGEAAKSPAFQQAVKDAGDLWGSNPRPLESHEEVGLVKGGVSFDAAQEKVEKLLRKAHSDFLARGFYLFRYEQHFGTSPDKVGLLPTTDKYAVIAAMGTNGVNYNIGTAGIMAWLRDLEAEQPFVLTGISFEHLEGFFTTTIKDRKSLARRMYHFCPDIVDQGVSSVAKLAEELRKGELYFWWD